MAIKMNVRLFKKNKAVRIEITCNSEKQALETYQQYVNLIHEQQGKDLAQQLAELEPETVNKLS